MDKVIVQDSHEECEHKEPSPRLDPWRSHPHLAGHLLGIVYGHTILPDGELVTTTRLMSSGSGWAQTRNTFYVLGRHDPSLR